MSKQEDDLNWRDHFSYKGGRLYWNQDVICGKGRISHPAGKEAGGRRKRGRFDYWSVSVKGRRYYRHRVVWEMHNGPIPEGYVVNHLNGKPGDDRIENLEVVPASENNMIHKTVNMYSTNTSGYRGVRYNPKRGRWEAQGYENGKTKHLGRFESLIEARIARESWENSRKVL